MCTDTKFKIKETPQMTRENVGYFEDAGKFGLATAEKLSCN